jgi:hypothetical protein
LDVLKVFYRDYNLKDIKLGLVTKNTLLVDESEWRNERTVQLKQINVLTPDQCSLESKKSMKFVMKSYEK